MGRKSTSRGRLIDAAIAVIESDGEQAVRVNAIADTAGVAKASVYHYFGDRDGLVTAAYAEMYRRAVLVTAIAAGEFANAVTSQAEYEAALLRLMQSTHTPEAEHRRALLTSVLGASVTRPRLREALIEINREVAQMNAQFARIGMEKGLVTMPFDPLAAGLVAMALFSDRYYVDMDEGEGVSRSEWDAVVFEMLRHVLFDSFERRT